VFVFEVALNLVGSKKPEPFGPNIFCRPQGDPYVGVNEVGTAHRLRGSSVIVTRGPALLVLRELGKYVAPAPDE
jgi:hypothetical protein